MTANADILLFAYSIVLVGAVTGGQMLYFGIIRKTAMRLGGNPVEPKQLLGAGAIFAVAGVLSVAVMFVELLSGAAGTDLTVFLVATFVVPAATLAFNAYGQRT